MAVNRRLLSRKDSPRFPDDDFANPRQSRDVLLLLAGYSLTIGKSNETHRTLF